MNALVAAAILAWPMPGARLTQRFGPTELSRRNPELYQGGIHWGVDLSAGFGAPVRAAADGTVQAAGSEECPDSGRPDCNQGSGNWLILSHPRERLQTFYGHLKRGSRLPTGTPVRRGDVIGAQGASGRVTGSHLHFAAGRFDIYRSPEGLTLYFVDPDAVYDPLPLLP